MKFIYKISTIGLVLVALMVVSSCTKDFTKINTDPNNPEEVPATNILAYTIEELAANYYDVWGDMNEPETYAGHLGKIQYIDESRYVYRESIVNTLWEASFRLAHDLKNVIDIAQTNENTNMEAAALTWQALVLSITTNRWRDIPYTDALKGDSGALTPTYDKQEDIYPALLSRLKTAADLFQEGTGELGAGDLLYDGDASKWQKFCNSLRLRLAIHISNVAPDQAKAVIEEVFNNPDKYPILGSNEDNAFMWWPGTDPYYEPWYSDYQGRDDHAVSDVMINTLKDLDDPRLPIYAQTAPDDETKTIYRGVPIGPAGSVDINHFSRIGVRFREDPEGFTPFMRYAEVLFIEAEAAQRGWNVPLSAEEAYTKAVTASMEENGVSAADIKAYLSSSSVAYKGDLEQIYLQKWIALYKDGNEAWVLTRRTDVPLLPAAEGSPYPGHNRPPFRYPYPTKEATLNGKNLAPFIKNVDDSFWGQQMWWDTREGVK